MADEIDTDFLADLLNVSEDCRTESKTKMKDEKKVKMDTYRKYVSKLLDSNLLKPGEIYKYKITDDRGIEKPILQDFLSLDVIFWDVPSIFAKNKNVMNFLCPECGSIVNAVPIGPQKRFMLRTLYGLTENVLLITTLFRCIGIQKHEILGYDPRLPMCDGVELPFLLFHRAGMTHALVDFILTKIKSGTKIYQLQKTIAQNYFSTYEKRKEIYVNCCSIHASKNESEVFLFEEFPSHEPSSPSLTFVTQSVLTLFKEKEGFYRHAMQEIKSNEYFFCDDSFQFPLYVQTSKADSTKTHHFKNVMYVCNLSGQVMTWQLTKDDSFEEMASALLTMKIYQKEKHDMQFKGCYSNHCCEWKLFYQQIFGKDFNLKANLIKFFDNFAKHMTPNCAEQLKCFQSLGLVFRQKDDTNVLRMKNTAEPIVIKENLKSFIEEWKDVKTACGTSVLPPACLDEIISLDSHIDHGCYSEIPPITIDTLIFRDIHQTLEQIISNTKTGLPLTMVLITIRFHEINVARGDVISEEGYKEIQKQNSSQSLDKQKLNVLSLIEILERFFVGQQQNLDLEEKRKLKDVLMYARCFQSISHFMPDLITMPRLIPFFLSSLCLLSSPPISRMNNSFADYFKDVDILKQWLSSGNISLDRAKSLVTAIVNYLHSYFELNSNNENVQLYYNTLKLKGISFTEPIDNIVQNHIHWPQLTDSWQVLTAAANLFDSVIFVLTGFKRFPILPVYPTEWNHYTPNIFLLCHEDSFTPIVLDLSADVKVSDPNCSSAEGQPGSAALPSISESNVKNFRCRCGRGMAEGKLQPKCVNLENQKYPTRCLCYRANEPCTSACDCRGCENPIGKRISNMKLLENLLNGQKSVKRTRKRHAHDGQKLLGDILSRVPTILSPSTISSWNLVECLIFELALNTFISTSKHQDLLNPWPTTTTREFNILLNNFIASVQQVPGFEKCVSLKSDYDVDNKLQEREVDVMCCQDVFFAHTA